MAKWSIVLRLLAKLRSEPPTISLWDNYPPSCQPKWGIFNHAITLVEGADWKVTIVRNILLLQKTGANGEQECVNLTHQTEGMPYTTKSRLYVFNVTIIPEHAIPAHQPILAYGRGFVVTYCQGDLFLHSRDEYGYSIARNLSAMADEVQHAVLEMDELFKGEPHETVRWMIERVREEKTRKY